MVYRSTEFGHIISGIKGKNGVEIARKAYYNIYKKEASIDEIIEYLGENISEYAVVYSDNGKKQKFDVKKYGEITAEVFAKHNSNADEFTKEFIKLLKGA